MLDNCVESIEDRDLDGESTDDLKTEDKPDEACVNVRVIREMLYEQDGEIPANENILKRANCGGDDDSPDQVLAHLVRRCSFELFLDLIILANANVEHDAEEKL